MKINKETCFNEVLIILAEERDESLSLKVGDTVKVTLEKESGFNDEDLYEGVLTHINADGFGMEETSEDGWADIGWEYVIEIEKVKK